MNIVAKSTYDFMFNSNANYEDIIKILKVFCENKNINKSIEENPDVFLKINFLNNKFNNTIYQLIEKEFDKLIQSKLDEETTLIDKFENIYCYLEIFETLKYNLDLCKRKRYELYSYFFNQMKLFDESELTDEYDFISCYGENCDNKQILILKIIFIKELYKNNTEDYLYVNYLENLYKLMQNIGEYSSYSNLSSFMDEFKLFQITKSINDFKKESDEELNKISIENNKNISFYVQLSKLFYNLKYKKNIDLFNNNESSYRSMLNSSLTFINIAINKEPNNSNLYINRSLIYLKKLEYEKALEDIRKALSNEINFLESNSCFFEESMFFYNFKESTLFNFLNFLINVNNTAELNFLIGEFIYKIILNKFINYKEYIFYMEHSILNKLYKSNEISKEALNYFEKAYDKKNDILYLKRCIELQIILKNWDKALDLINSIKEHNKDIDIKYLHACTLFYIKKFDEAKIIFKNLYDKLNEIKYLKFYFNCLFYLNDLSYLLDYYKKNITPFDKETTKANTVWLENFLNSNKEFNQYTQQGYNVKNIENKKITSNNTASIKNIYVYNESLIDKVYKESIINTDSYDPSDNYPMWLGETESEESFWEH